MRIENYDYQLFLVISLFNEPFVVPQERYPLQWQHVLVVVSHLVVKL